MLQSVTRGILETSGRKVLAPNERLLLRPRVLFLFGSGGSHLFGIWLLTNMGE